MKDTFITHVNQSAQFTEEFFQYCIQHTFDDPSVRVRGARFLTTGGKVVLDAKYHSNLQTRIIGFQQYELEYERGGEQFHRKALVKSKQSERELLEVIGSLCRKCGLNANLSSPAFLAPAIGFTKCDRKEMEIYRMQASSPAFSKYQPELLGLYLDEVSQDFVIVMECLDEEILSSNTVLLQTDQESIEATIDGMAELHAVWYHRTESLAQQPWMSTPMNTTSMISLIPLWKAFAHLSQRYLGEFITKADLEFHSDLLEHMDRWWREIEALPKTLIHNDFVPKNAALKQVEGKKSLCLFDWETSIIHLPQRDLCEFLCYVLDQNVSPTDVIPLVDRHRLRLEQSAKTRIDPIIWQHGFRLCLNDYFINRLALGVLIEDLEPRNIGKLYRTARRLIEMFARW